METFRYPVDVGARDGSRFQPGIAVVDPAATYVVMPSPLLTMCGPSRHRYGIMALRKGRK